MRLNLLVLAALAVMVLPLAAQSPPASATTEPTHRPRVIVPWRHFGPPPAESQTAANIPQPSPTANPEPSIAPAKATADRSPATGDDQGSNTRPAEPDERSGQPPDQAPDALSSPVVPSSSGGTSDSATDASTAARASPEQTAASRVEALSADYARREQDRDSRRQELEAAAHSDPTVQALADIQTTRLLLEGEQDRMQSSGQLSQAFSDLASKLQSDTEREKRLLDERRQSAEQATAEISRIKAEAPELNLALKNLALLPAGGDNDNLMRSIAARLDQEDEALRIDQQRSQEDLSEIKGLEIDQQELVRASGQARAKAASLARASEDAKVKQGLLADRLEFSVQRKRASDELSDTAKVLERSLSVQGRMPAEQAPPGEQSPQSVEGVAAPPAATTSAPPPPDTRATTPAGSADGNRQAIESLRDCIRRTGDVAACRAGGGGQP